MTRVVRLDAMDNAFQHAEVLKRNRTRRHQSGECFVEGVRPIQRLVESGWPVRSIWSDRGRPLSRWAEEIVRASGAECHYRLSGELMERLSDREDPSELVLVAATRRPRLSDLALPDGFLVLVLDRPASPGNLGTVVRSADAFGADALVIAGHAADPFDPRAIRASTGSVFRVPLVAIEGATELAAWLDGRPGVRVLGTDSRGELPLRSADLRSRAVVVLGNEGAGLSYRFRELCTDVVRIPVRNDSLNMAVAASIVLYEAAGQR
ncbi:MAG TPA: TrmH family RNA methyltransferase [Candidatus Dormibacteraeota bacterium]|nr:TrmH family RNA methyltransferase [Candidatus Dormibacteraeota bacterium]